MKKIMTALAAFGILLVLTGCSEEGATGVGNGVGGAYPVMVTFPGGRVVPCVVYDGYNAGGVSCDWSER